MLTYVVNQWAIVLQYAVTLNKSMLVVETIALKYNSHLAIRRNALILLEICVRYDTLT